MIVDTELINRMNEKMREGDKNRALKPRICDSQIANCNTEYIDAEKVNMAFNKAIFANLHYEISKIKVFMDNALTSENYKDNYNKVINDLKKLI